MKSIHIRNMEYTHAHLIAKSLVCCAVIGLGIAGIETGNPYLPLVFGTVLWFFGINTCGYVIEKCAGKNPSHNIF